MCRVWPCTYSANISFSVLPSTPTYMCVLQVRTVFATSPVQTAHSVVTLTLELYETVKRADLRVDLDNWDSAFGVVNRVVFPVASDQVSRCAMQRRGIVV